MRGCRNATRVYECGAVMGEGWSTVALCGCSVAVVWYRSIWEGSKGIVHDGSTAAQRPIVHISHHHHHYYCQHHHYQPPSPAYKCFSLSITITTKATYVALDLNPLYHRHLRCLLPHYRPSYTSRHILSRHSNPYHGFQDYKLRFL